MWLLFYLPIVVHNKVVRFLFWSTNTKSGCHFCRGITCCSTAYECAKLAWLVLELSPPWKPHVAMEKNVGKKRGWFRQSSATVTATWKWLSGGWNFVCSKCLCANATNNSWITWCTASLNQMHLKLRLVHLFIGNCCNEHPIRPILLTLPSYDEIAVLFGTN